MRVIVGSDIEPEPGGGPPEIEELPAIRSSDAGWIVLLVATALYTCLTARWALRNHDGFGTLGFDFGIFDQGVWLLSRFHRPYITIMGRNLMNDHTSFILFALVPVYWIVPSGKVLLIAQACALGASAAPVYLIAREKLRDELLAAGVAVAFLAHPVLAWTNFEQFHPDAFEVPLLLYALWFMLRQRWRPYLLCVASLLLIKEDVFLVTFALGIYVAVRYSRRIGLLTSGISATYLALVLGVMKPGLVSGGLYVGRIPFGGYGGLLRATLTRPLDLARYLRTGGRPWYAWQLFSSFGLVPLLAPRLLLIGLGPFAFNMLSTFVFQHRIRYHYATLLLPVLVTAAICGIAGARSLRHRALLVAVMIVSSLLSGYLWGPVPRARQPAYIGNPSSGLARDASAAIHLIPPDASVSAFYPFTTHLTHRVHVYDFPNPFAARWWNLGRQEGQRLPEADTVQYVILPKQSAYWTPELYAVLGSIQPDFETALDSENVVLLRRRQ